MSGCWLWTAYADPHGYGRYMHHKGDPWLAHRLAYSTLIGDPGRLALDHLCRVRCCVNPAHLEPVTNTENTRRGLAGENNRTKTHCPSGHAYDTDNTVFHASPWGQKRARACRACHDIANARWRENQRDNKTTTIAVCVAIGWSTNDRI